LFLRDLGEKLKSILFKLLILKFIASKILQIHCTKNDILLQLIIKLEIKFVFNTQVPLRRLIFTDTAIKLLAAKTEVFGDARISLGLASAIVQNVFDKADGGI
jgi:hypothetical protein